MTKRAKNAAKPTDARAQSAQEAAPSIAGHPPRKNPALLALSILLFVVWFAFLLVTALSG
jgi:hypothetical protein